MVRSTVKKVMWVGRATVFMVGLAVVLALVLGVAAAALGAPMNTFKLGQINTSNAISTLVGAVSGSNLKIENTGTNANATALELKVPQGNAPLTVNAGAGKATNLNADRLDDWEASSFADGVGGKATNAELLDGQDSSAFLGANQKVSDSDRLDGKDSAEFYATGSKVANSNQLDGLDSTGFIQGKGNMYRAQRTLGGGGVSKEGRSALASALPLLALLIGTVLAVLVTLVGCVTVLALGVSQRIREVQIRVSA
jgi:hypothetical protein